MKALRAQYQHGEEHDEPGEDLVGQADLGARFCWATPSTTAAEQGAP